MTFWTLENLRFLGFILSVILFFQFLIPAIMLILRRNGDFTLALICWGQAGVYCFLAVTFYVNVLENPELALYTRTGLEASMLILVTTLFGLGLWAWKGRK